MVERTFAKLFSLSVVAIESGVHLAIRNERAAVDDADGHF